MKENEITAITKKKTDALKDAYYDGNETILNGTF